MAAQARRSDQTRAPNTFAWPARRFCIVNGPCQPPAHEVARLRGAWEGCGLGLPECGARSWVDVRFAEDPDCAPSQVPACCLLGQLGLCVAHDRLDSAPICATLRRLAGELLLGGLS